LFGWDAGKEPSRRLAIVTGGLTFKGALVVSKPRPDGQPPLSLGTEAISKLHVFVATREKVLYFTAAGERR
jgi:hypothetical protein